MTDPLTTRTSDVSDDETSILAWGAAVLRWRRTIVVLGLAGGALGLVRGLTSSRLYVSSATFVPQSGDAAQSGLAAAASQFGIRVQQASANWGPPMYVELLQSPAVLAPVALDTVVVAEMGNRRAPIWQLLNVNAATASLQREYAVTALKKVENVVEVKALGAVKVSVMTKWPSVSLAVTQRLLQAINDFNLNTRKSQASAERQFVEQRAKEAQDSLSVAENHLLEFLQSNRTTTGSPELSFQRDRLQRDVSLRTQVYTSLLQSREEAKMREVRDTPVITVIEPPQLPNLPEARGTVRKAFLGGVGGGLLGVLIAVIAQMVADIRRRPSAEADEFFRLIDEATPRFLQRVRAR